LDVSKNDIPDPRIEITGLPAIYFLERGSGGKAHKFEGPRYKDKLLKFAHEHLGDVPADKEAEAPAAAPAPAPAEDAAKQEL